jgi:transcriptional regulator with XRE-family HTH domain
MTFGQRMRTRREHLGLSQEALAQLTGIAQTRLSEFENDVRTDMTVSTALKIARTLGVGLDYLVGTFDAAADAPPDAATRGAPRGPARRRGRPRKATPARSA